MDEWECVVMDHDDRRMMAISVISDLIDLLPPLPFINTLQSVIDAGNIQAVRSKYPQAKASTGIGLLETIDFPIPFIPSPLELLPSHVVATALAIRNNKKEQRRERNIELAEQSRWKRW